MLQPSNNDSEVDGTDLVCEWPDDWLPCN